MREKFKNLFNKDVILDTNIITDLRELNILTLPLKIFSEVCISKNILYQELSDEEGHELLIMGYKPLSLETNQGFEKLFYLKDNFKRLSISDKIIICIAYEKSLLCCTNDGQARKACEELNVDITGTLGILCSAYENGIIDWNKFVRLFNKYEYDTSSYLSSEITEQVRRIYKIPQIDSNIIPYNVHT